MTHRRIPCFICSVIFTLLSALFSGCDGDCEEEYQVCLSKVQGNLSKYSYEDTCRYPTMNRGDEKAFCDCEEDRKECTGR